MPTVFYKIRNVIMLKLIRKAMIEINAIYIDVLFFVNFIINICLIASTGSVMKLKLTSWRIFVSSAIGAIYSCLIFVGDFNALTSVSIRFLFVTLIVLTAFGRCKIRQLIKRCLVFFSLTVSLGIVTLAVLYFSDIGIRLGGIVKNGVFYFNIPMSLMLVSCITAYIAICILKKIFKKNISRSYVCITIHHLGKTVELKALIDTGNMLKDPFTGKKVLIAELNVLKPLFDFDTKAVFEDFENLPEGFRLIPYSSIGNECGLIAAFVPDSIQIEKTEENNIITAVFSGSLSVGGDYNALIGP